MDKDFFLKTRFLKIIVIVFAVVVVVSLIFSAGFFVGARKARFSCAWGDNYHRNFGMPNKEFLPGPMREMNDRFPEFNDREFMNPNGVFGKIIKIIKAENNTSSSEIIISSSEGLERNILLDNRTNIKIFRDNVNIDQLKADQFVAIIGDIDNAGQINAKLIRVMPEPRGDIDALK